MRAMAKSFVVLEKTDPLWVESNIVLFDDEEFGWAIAEMSPEGKIARLVGYDGGEPEDQLLVRDWSWVVDALNAERAKVAARDKDLQNLKEAARRVAGFLPRHHHLCGIVCEESLLFEGEARQCDCGTDRLYAALGEEQISSEVMSDGKEEAQD